MNMLEEQDQRSKRLLKYNSGYILLTCKQLQTTAR